MEGPTRPPRGTCAHCETADQWLSRLVLVAPDGKKRDMMVCSLCYLQLTHRRAPLS